MLGMPCKYTLQFFLQHCSQEVRWGLRVGRQSVIHIAYAYACLFLWSISLTVLDREAKSKLQSCKLPAVGGRQANTGDLISQDVQPCKSEDCHIYKRRPSCKTRTQRQGLKQVKMANGGFSRQLPSDHTGHAPQQNTMRLKVWSLHACSRCDRT